MRKLVALELGLLAGLTGANAFANSRAFANVATDSLDLNGDGGDHDEREHQQQRRNESAALTHNLVPELFYADSSMARLVTIRPLLGWLRKRAKRMHAKPRAFLTEPFKSKLWPGNHVAVRPKRVEIRM